MNADDRRLLVLCLAILLCGGLWLHSVALRDAARSRKPADARPEIAWTQQPSVEIQP